MDPILNSTANGPSAGTSKLFHDNKDGLHKLTFGRKIVVIRHGERIDFTFNPTHENWIHKAFDYEGNYNRFSINMPRTMPYRKDGFANYLMDTPLTEMGYLQAKITGRALKDASFKPTYVYSSPAYRSIQTAIGIIKGLNMQEGKLKINIETGLFECGGWYEPKLPLWMAPEELADNGYPVNVEYKPFAAKQDISPWETLNDCYNRSFMVVKKILDKHQHEDCIIALVAHAGSLDTCTRQLVGGAPRSERDFDSIANQTPYLALATAKEDPLTKSWKLYDPPVLPFQHHGNAAYDWKQLNK